MSFVCYKHEAMRIIALREFHESLQGIIESDGVCGDPHIYDQLVRSESGCRDPPNYGSI